MVENIWDSWMWARSERNFTYTHQIFVGDRNITAQASLSKFRQTSTGKPYARVFLDSISHFYPPDSQTVGLWTGDEEEEVPSATKSDNVRSISFTLRVHRAFAYATITIFIHS